MARIVIGAMQVLDLGGGFYEVEVADRPLTPEQRTLISTLFPNLYDRAYGVLEQEAILSSVLSSEEAAAIYHRKPGDVPKPVAKKRNMDAAKPTM